MQNPSVQQWNLGIEKALPHGVVLRVDGVHNLGTHFIIGRTIGEVFNPVVGGPDRVVNLESSVNTHYDALLVSAERARADVGFRASYTLRQGAELRQRRPDPVRQRADRSDQPAARVRPDAERPAPQLHAGRRGRRRGPGSWWRRSCAWRPACRWTSCCPTRRRASRPSSATPAAASSRPAPS